MSMQDVMKTVIGHVPDRLLPATRPQQLDGKRTHLGVATPRIDGPLKVQGQARFAAEVALEGLLYGAVVHSTIARGSIVSLEVAAAEAAPGVTHVMTYRNAPRINAPITMDEGGAAGSSLPVMQDASIHWNGEAVAIVLAKTQEQADYAASLVQVNYAAEAAMVDFDQAKDDAHHPDSVLGEPPVLEQGDAEQALGKAAFKVDQRYTTPRNNHNAIELHAVTVQWNGAELVVHDATQMLNGTAKTLAEVFDLKPEQVHVLSPFVGGGFGGKGLWTHQILASLASKLAGSPVRLTLSRAGVFRLIGGRTLTEQRVALGANADGTLTALIHTGVVAMTAHNNCPEQFTFPARHLYAADNFYLEQQVADMDMLANTFMRAPGESVGTFALESALDELAEQLDIDPIELRRRIEPTKDPTSGAEFSSRHLLQAYADGARAFGWERRSPKPRTRREGEWLIGMGVATATYPYYRMPGAAAKVRIDADGTATVFTAGHEMGMGTATVQAQHAADRLGLELHQVSFAYGDTSLPAGAMAGGSSQTAGTLAAVEAAVQALIGAMLKLVPKASPLHGLRAEKIELRNGGIGSTEAAQVHQTYAELLHAAGETFVEAQADGPAPLEVMKYSMHSYGAQFCEVRVSEVTGEVRISRFLGSFDTGRILNPQTAASQFRGGIVMGLGLALTEETWFDTRSGRVMNPSLAEYHVPVQMDVPEIEVMWTNHPDPHAPLGAHGIGEIGITGTAAAVANAIYNATGKRIRNLPATLDKLL